MRKLMKYVKQYTWQSIICPILMVGEVVLELMLPYYMSYCCLLRCCCLMCCFHILQMYPCIMLLQVT